MRKIMLLLTLMSLSAFAGKKYPDLETVKNVEIQKYLGKWYEIASIPQWFSEGCTATEANYSLRKDGSLNVLNKCNLNSLEGELNVSKGRAWVKDKKTNSKLKVQFFLKSIKLPFLAGDYWILDLDEDYTRVLIGDPKRKTLWILAREKTLDEATYQTLLNKAEKAGFDISKMKRMAHKL